MINESVVPISSTVDQWRRALIRAKARGYEIAYVKTREVDGAATTYWRVSSNSQQGEWRSVAAARLDNGWTISCDCPAGENDKPCVHAALVFRELAVLTDPDPVVTFPTA